MDYREGARSVGIPALFVGFGGQCLSRGVETARVVQNGEFPIDRVTENEYWHADHAFGRNARKEVFPYVAGWLEEHGG